ncbi:MAG: TolC family protein [Bacteroidota bacterium]|nr:TolC family protein [Bacteroidota bacterium]
MRIKISTILFSLLIISFVAYSQTDSTITISLSEAQDIALESNVNVINAKLDVEISDKKVWETTTIGLPQVSAEGSYNNNLSLATSLLPAVIFGGPEGEFMEVHFGTQHNFNGTATISQLIFSGSYIVGLQAAKVYKSLSKNQLSKTKIDTKANVAMGYYSILLAENNKDILESNISTLKKTLKESEAMYKAGYMDETEVDKLKISLSNIENNLNSVNRQIEYLYSLLNLQLGIDNNIKIELTNTLDEVLSTINYSSVIKNNLSVENNIDYKIVKTQVKLQELNLKKEKAEYLPTLSAFYNYSENAMRNEFNPFDGSEKWFQSSMLGFSLKVPIFSSGKRHSKVQQANLELQKTQNSQKLLSESIDNSYLQAKNNFITANDNMLNAKANVQLAKKVLEKTTVKYKNGLSSSMELNQTNSDYLNTTSKYTQAIIDVLNAKIELEKIINKI